MTRWDEDPQFFWSCWYWKCIYARIQISKVHMFIPEVVPHNELEHHFENISIGSQRCSHYEKWLILQHATPLSMKIWFLLRILVTSYKDHVWASFFFHLNRIKWDLHPYILEISKNLHANKVVRPYEDVKWIHDGFPFWKRTLRGWGWTCVCSFPSALICPKGPLWAIVICFFFTHQQGHFLTPNSWIVTPI